MSQDITDILTQCHQMQQSGRQREDIVQYLYDNNLPTAEAVKTVRSLYSMDLIAADAIVRSHPAWRELGAVSGRLTAQFIEVVSHYSQVRLLTDRYTAEGVGVGDIGYIIEIYEDSACEVEFSNHQGITYAQVVVQSDELAVWEPMEIDHDSLMITLLKGSGAQ